MEDCVFVDDWKCGIDGENIPLAACDTCIRARTRASEDRKTVPRAVKKRSGPVTTTDGDEGKGQEGKLLRDRDRARGSGRELKNALAELDRRFAKGEVSLNNYVKSRREITSEGSA